MALVVERVVDGGVHAEEALGGSSRFEALQLALSSSHRLMRVLRAIVRPKPLLVTAGQAQMAERRGVGAQLVGHQQLRRKALLPEQLAHQPQGSPLVSPTLHEHIEDLALVVDARHRYIRLPAMRTTISSRCHRSLGRGRRWCSRRAKKGPNFRTQRRTVS